MQAATGRPQGKEAMLKFERGNTRSHSVENSLFNRLQTCRKTDYEMNKRMTSLETD
jgi:hypothetical protein